mgnify:CR=1 FL=1
MSLRRVVILGAMALGSFLLASCGGDADAEVVVYTGRHYDLEAAFTQFAEETGISVAFLPGTDVELRERIAAEGEETQADVFLTVDAGNLAIAADEGLFAPLDSPLLDEAVPANFRDPDSLWFGLTLRARTIIYNSDVLTLDQVPTTYEELADPIWDGRLCLRNSSNVYTQSLVASMIAHHGESEALRIVSGWADDAEILANDTLIIDSIAAGLCDVGIANHYYLARSYEQDPNLPVALVWANQDPATPNGRGTHVNISGGGVTRYADNPDLAQQLLEWLATDGQHALVDPNHEYPINSTVAPESLIADRFGVGFLQDDLDAATFGRLNPDAVRLMDQAGYE